MSARNSWIVPFLLVSAVIGRAQQPSPAPDFAEGFKQLVALGMPALDAKTTWAVIPEAANSNYQLREVAKSVKGNAWLLPLADGKSSAIALGSADVIELNAAKKRPAELDLTKDVEAILAGLKKLVAKMNADPDRDPFSSGFSYGGSYGGSNFGNLLLFAAQLQQTGHTDLANRLALAVFEVFPSREAAVDAAVDLLAGHFYQQACRAFFTSGDWPAYHTALTGLCKRFPRGWSNRDAVAMLLPQLEKQATGTKAPAPTLPDIAIDPRAIALIRELTDKPPADPKQKPKDNKAAALSAAMRYRMQMSEGYDYDGESSGPPSLWLISEARADDDADSSVQFRLAALKMAAIPALAALTGDPFLTHLPNSRSYSGYYSSNSNSEDRTLALYAALNRPATRGEIAVRLLAATLPDAQRESDPSQVDPEAIRETALAFWKDHKDATREELAAVFLRDGSSNQSSQAASILAASTEPKAHQAFEAHVLAADPAIATFQDVQTYLRSRKAAAKPFLEAYAKLVRSQGGAGDSEDSNQNAWAVKQAGGAEKILKQLETLVGSQSPRALALQIAKGKPADAQAAISSLSDLLNDATPVKHLHALLEGANAATDATVRARFLSVTSMIRWEPDDADTEPSDEGDPAAKPADKPAKEDAAPAARKVSEPEAVVWRKLLADTRSVSSQFNPRNRYQRSGTDSEPTIAEIAACAFETSVQPGAYGEAQSASVILNKTASAILVEQATARLAGKPVPPLPDASKITEQRLAEIVATAGKTPAAEIHPFLTSLTPDERAAWLEWFKDPGELPRPESVKTLQHVITARTLEKSPSFPDVKGAGNIDVGFSVSGDSLTKHIESLAAEIDKHSRTFIGISPANFGPGLELITSVFPLQPEPAKNASPKSPDAPRARVVTGAQVFSEAISALEANPKATAIVMAYASAYDSRSSSRAVWLVQDGKATPQGPSEDSETSEEPFAATVKKLLESDKDERFYISIQILTRTDADKFAAAKTGRTGSTDDPDGDSSDPSENSSSSAEDPSPSTEDVLQPP